MSVIILKVGTSVVTDVNGQLDTDRIAGMVTEMSVLIKDGYRFILITSGAVACGRAVLAKYTDSDASNNLNLDENLRLRMSAAIGQPILFQEYQRNLSDKNVVSAQVLVTEIDFQDPDRRHSIEQALLNMLERGIVPIINENDAITTRTTKYRDGQGKILWDNDSLAGLIGRSVLSNLPPNASIQLCLASNIDGVYNTKLQVIPTWTQLSLETVTNNLATTSSYGRGGITAKITAATGCANDGITTVIFNGMVTDNISKVVRGDTSVGTWFYPPTPDLVDDTGGDNHADSIYQRCYQVANQHLRHLTHQQQTSWLSKLQLKLQESIPEILAANQTDLATAEQSNLSPHLLHRLTLTQGKISTLIQGISDLKSMPSPIGHQLASRVIPHPFVPDQTLTWSRHQIPLGLILVIFESRPDVLVQLVALAVKSGNGLVLKGGSEAKATLQALFRVFISATPKEYQDGFALLLDRSDTTVALTRPEFSLIIPRGSESFVNYVRKQACAPVIGHGAGICCAYVHHDINLISDLVLRTITHAKLDYPAACNALELVVLPKKTVTDDTQLVEKFITCLETAGISIQLTKNIANLLRSTRAEGATPREIVSVITEHHDNTLTLDVSDTLTTALGHINQVGSSHTDLILTNDKQVVQVATNHLKSSCVFWNCSTRAADGYRMKLGCEVGINTSESGWFRGPVGLEALMTTQIRLSN